MAMKLRSKSRYNESIRYAKLQGDADSDEHEEIEILPQKPKKTVETMTIEVDPGDTLQAIALKYHCNLGELKRLNFIHRENEIHAKKTLRVPIVPHSLLLETITGVHASGNTSPTSQQQVAADHVIQADIDEKLHVQLQNQSDLNKAITHVMDNTNGAIITNGFENIENSELTDDIDLVTSRNQLWFEGDDCGMSWLLLLVLALVICVVCPLIYIFYLTEHPDILHHKFNH